jgi:hypothetical protein
MRPAKPSVGFREIPHRSTYQSLLLNQRVAGLTKLPERCRNLDSVGVSSAFLNCESLAVPHRATDRSLKALMVLKACRSAS